MARPSSSDPLDKFRWCMAIELDGVESFTRLGFTSVEVPQVDIATRSYPEGGAHLFPKQIVDSVSYRPIALERGVTDNLDFHKWAQGYIELVRGKREDGATEQSSLTNLLAADGLDQARPISPTEYRRTVIIIHLDREGRGIKKYTLYNAFPIEYKPASNFDSTGDDLLSMERLVLSYESFDVESIEQDANPLDPRDVFKRLVRRAF